MSVVLEHEQATVPTQMDSSGDVDDAALPPRRRLRLFGSAPSSSSLAIEYAYTVGLQLSQPQNSVNPPCVVSIVASTLKDTYRPHPVSNTYTAGRTITESSNEQD